MQIGDGHACAFSLYYKDAPPNLGCFSVQEDVFFFWCVSRGRYSNFYGPKVLLAAFRTLICIDEYMEEDDEININRLMLARKKALNLISKSFRASFSLDQSKTF